MDAQVTYETEITKGLSGGLLDPGFSGLSGHPITSFDRDECLLIKSTYKKSQDYSMSTSLGIGRDL